MGDKVLNVCPSKKWYLIYLRFPIRKGSIFQHKISSLPRLNLAAELGQVSGLLERLLRAALSRAVVVRKPARRRRRKQQRRGVRCVRWDRVIVGSLRVVRLV